MKVFNANVLFTIAAVALSTAAFTAAEASRSRPSAPPETPVDVYQRSWEHRALKAQEQLQRYNPLKQSTFVHTHNSYNTKAWGSAFSYWVDPNQIYSIKDQLRMDVMNIELDVHWYFAMHGWPWEWGNKPLLCHGQDNHTGCSSTDRDLNDGLDEVSSYIRSNRDRVVIIYIEEHLSGNWNSALGRIKNKLGDLIYRTGSTSCQDAPVDLTRDQVLRAGKNIILWSGGCTAGEWAGYVYKKNNTVPEANVESFTSYSDCGSAKFNRDTYNSKIIRFYEDRTNMSAWFGGGSGKTTPTNMAEMVKCGVNLLGNDKLEPTDGRLAAAVWSFGVNEPNDYGSNEDCVQQRGDQFWNDNNCNASFQYACSNGYGSWAITSGAGVWTGGASACAALGNGFAFARPKDGYDNMKLHEVKTARRLGGVWINAHDRNSEGTYQ